MSWRDLYVINNAASKVSVYTTHDKAAAHYIHHNVRDTRMIYVDESSFNNTNKNSSVEISVEELSSGWYQLYQRKFIKVTPTDALMNHRTRMTILHNGYSFLNSVISNITSHINYSSYFLTIDDINMFPNIDDLAETLSDAIGVDREIAIKQLAIEKSCLLNIQKHKNFVLWKYSTLLLKANSKEDLSEWKLKVRAEASGLGLI